MRKGIKRIPPILIRGSCADPPEPKLQLVTEATSMQTFYPNSWGGVSLQQMWFHFRLAFKHHEKGVATPKTFINLLSKRQIRQKKTLGDGLKTRPSMRPTLHSMRKSGYEKGSHQDKRDLLIAYSW